MDAGHELPLKSKHPDQISFTFIIQILLYSQQFHSHGGKCFVENIIDYHIKTGN